MAHEKTPDEFWAEYLHGRDTLTKVERRIFSMLPHDPRCKSCRLPFAGLGGRLLRLIGYGPSRKNPRYCNMCELYVRRYRGGAEVPMSFLFADVRGSTAIAERMSPSEFTRLLNRFYAAANRAIIDRDGLIDKLVGDEVVAFFPPYVGNHARAAVETARALLAATGHDGTSEPWLPMGIGVHTGRAYYGVVGTEDTVSDITALGDDVNVAARLVGLAASGEVLISDAAAAQAGVDLGGAERRRLDLKGRTQPIDVHVLRLAPTPARAG